MNKLTNQVLLVLRNDRDPVLYAEASKTVKANKASHRTSDGLAVHSFATLLAELSCRGRVTYRMVSDAAGPTFRQITKPTNLQAKALELLGLFP